MSDIFDPADVRQWMTVLIGSLSASLTEPAAVDAQDPVLELERQWWAVNDAAVPLEAAHTALRAKMAERIGREPWDRGGRTKWRRDPDAAKLAKLNDDIDHLLDRQYDIMDQMVETDATTLAGIHAKLRLVGVANLSNRNRDRAWVPAPLLPVTLGMINETIRALAEAPV